MKKKFLTLLFVFSILVFSSVAFGQSDIQVYVNDNKVVFPDASPFISNGRTLVPVRFIADSLEAKTDWSQSTQEVTIEKGNEKIVLKIGEKKAKVGSKTIELDTNALIKNSRTFVPLRFISETFDAKVEWVQATKTVYINTDGKSTVIKPIEEVIKNKEVIYSDIIKTVKFVDVDKYNFELLTFEEQLFILSTVDTYAMLFIKDGKIEHQIYPMPVEDKYYFPIDFELNEFDYIGIYNFRSTDMEVMPNVFKK